MYSYNLEFFDRWSASSAYVVGLLMADGNVHKRTVSIQIRAADLELLRFACSHVSPEKPIDVCQRNNRSYVRFRANSKTIMDQLAQHGIVPNKSFVACIPSSLPEEYFGAFLRGYFDGNGWVTLRRNSIESGICSASESLIRTIDARTRLASRVRVRKDHRVIEVVWSKSATMQFRSIIYPTGLEFGLARKKNKLFSDFHTPSSKYWTDAELELLRRSYSPGNLSELTKLLSRSYKSISKKIWELGLCPA